MKNEFEFHLHSYEKMIYHWMLEGKEVLIDQISQTPEWKDNKTFVARVTVNGVELPFESLEKYLHQVFKNVVDQATERFSDLDKEVERRLKERLKKEVEPIIEKLDSFRNKLEEVDEVIKPYWEK